LQGREDVTEVEKLVEEAGSAAGKRQERLDREILVSTSGCRREQARAAHWPPPCGTEDAEEGSSLSCSALQQVQHGHLLAHLG